MEVHFAPDLQEKLTVSATKQGCAADMLIQDVRARYLADEARFFEVVENWSEAEKRAASSQIEEDRVEQAIWSNALHLGGETRAF